MTATRRLAAIPAADVAGYSRLMGAVGELRSTLVIQSPPPVFRVGASREQLAEIYNTRAAAAGIGEALTIRQALARGRAQVGAVLTS